MQIGPPAPIDGTPATAPAAALTDAAVRGGGGAVATADRADIRPLSVQAALQILLAEIFDAWALPPVAARPDAPWQAAEPVVRSFLQALPADAAGPEALLSRHDELLARLLDGVQRAQAIVAAWRDAPRETLDALAEAHAIVHAALADDLAVALPAAPWALRPEWLDLVPRLNLLRRRRRRARRRLVDPDLPLPEADDDERLR